MQRFYFYLRNCPFDKIGMCKYLLLILIVLPSFTGCATNPVTGKNELMLIPESMELAMGKKNYQPARQMQGGDYVADPEVIAYVREVGNKIAAVSDRRLPYEFTVLNDSSINAWAMPGGKLAINRGLLLKMDSESELAAVLGHEVVHAAAKHGAKQMQQALFLQGAVAAANIALEANVEDENLQMFGVIGSQAVATLLSAKFGRDDERESDHYGMTYMSRAGYDPQGAVKIQQVLLKESQGRSNDLISKLLSTHPPSQERVDNNRAFAAQLPSGKTGREEYHQRLSHLFKAAPAYAAYDEGVKAIKKKNFKKARKLAEKAIRIEPNEAQFHLLKGSVLEQTYHGQSAIAEYRKAIRLSPNYFEPHLRLGLLYDAMGNRYEAKSALESSVHLLKTASAMRRLGKYALADGNTKLAKQYLSEAAGSNTADGKAAYTDLLRFDLPVNAGKYLKANVRKGKDSILQFVIQNKTPFAVSNVVVFVSDNSGSKRLNARGVIRANGYLTVSTKAKVTQEQLNNISIKVVSATLVQ